MVKLAEIDAKPSVFVPKPSCQGGFGEKVCFYSVFFILGIMFVLCGCCSINFLECNLEMLAPMIWSLLVLFK